MGDFCCKVGGSTDPSCRPTDQDCPPESRIRGKVFVCNATEEQALEQVPIKAKQLETILNGSTSPAGCQAESAQTHHISIVDRHKDETLSSALPSASQSLGRDAAKYLLQAGRESIWIDLLPAQSYQIDHYLEISQLIREYHCLAKGDSNTLVGRIRLLDKIAILSGHALKKNGSPNLELLHQTALNKSKYLTLLQKVPSKYKKRVDPPKGDAIRMWLGRGANSIELVRALDPGKRMWLHEYQSVWEKEVESKTVDTGVDQIALDQVRFPMNFFLWLESQDIRSFNGTPSGAGGYHTPKDRKVTFKGGRAYSKFYGERSAAPIDIEGLEFYPIKEKKYLYNIDVKGELYVGEFMNHNLVNKEKDLISAGFVEFQDGKISYIDNFSGHYTPSQRQFKLGIDRLKAKYGESIFAEDAKLVLHSETEQPANTRWLMDLTTFEELLEIYQSLPAIADSKTILSCSDETEVFSVGNLMKECRGSFHGDFLSANKEFKKLSEPFNVKWSLESEKKIVRSLVEKLANSDFFRFRKEIDQAIMVLRSHLHKDDMPEAEKVLKLLFALEKISNIYDELKPETVLTVGRIGYLVQRIKAISDMLLAWKLPLYSSSMRDIKVDPVFIPLLEDFASQLNQYSKSPNQFNFDLYSISPGLYHYNIGKASNSTHKAVSTIKEAGLPFDTLKVIDLSTGADWQFAQFIEMDNQRKAKAKDIEDSFRALKNCIFKYCFRKEFKDAVGLK